MLGSHNSLTYLTPKTIWGKILSPWTKCQNKFLDRQFDSGVRYFDIRVKFDKNGNPIIVHNKIKYKGDLINILDQFNNYIKLYHNTDIVYLRIILDIRKTPYNKYEKDRQYGLFVDLCNRIDKNYTNLKVNTAITYWNWKSLENFNSPFTMIENHASVEAKWWQYLLGTKWYANKVKPLYKDYINSNEIYLVDYV